MQLVFHKANNLPFSARLSVFPCNVCFLHNLFFIMEFLDIKVQVHLPATFVPWR